MTGISFHFLKRVSCSFLFLLIYMLLAGIGTTVKAGSIDPVKIDVQTRTQSISEGDNAPIELVLKDANNKNVTAPKELTFSVEVRSQEGVLETQKVNMKAGEGTKTISIPFKKKGILEIRALQKELLGGSTFIHVKHTKKLPQAIIPPVAPLEKKTAPMKMPKEQHNSFQAEKKESQPMRGGETENESGSTTMPKEKSIRFQTGKIKSTAMKGVGSIMLLPREEALLSKTVEPKTAQIVEYASKPWGGNKITFKQSPQRPLRADGNDAATIYAFLVGDESVARREISIRLFNNKGSLIPKPLIIPMGKGSGSATLTSNDIGEITVEYLDSIPKLDIEGEKKFDIPFVPPVTSLEIKASPPAISLEDKANLVVRLLDNNGKVIATDRPLVISFTIDKGRGKLQDDGMTIPNGKYECRTQFSPTTIGLVEISASTPNILSKSVPIIVTFPVVITLLSVIGGIMGGLIKLLTTLQRKKDFNRWAVLFGLVAGPLLYWAVIFGTVSLFPNINALNLLSAFFISIIGGWLGTNVFSLILRRRS